MIKKILLSVLTLGLILGLSACSFSQSFHNEGVVVSKEYEDYLNKKQDLIVFEKTRTGRELKNWK